MRDCTSDQTTSSCVTNIKEEGEYLVGWRKAHIKNGNYKNIMRKEEIKNRMEVKVLRNNEGLKFDKDNHKVWYLHVHSV